MRFIKISGNQINNFIGPIAITDEVNSQTGLITLKENQEWFISLKNHRVDNFICLNGDDVEFFYGNDFLKMYSKSIIWKTSLSAMLSEIPRYAPYNRLVKHT